MERLAKFTLPVAAFILRKLPTHRMRKKFAKKYGPFFEGNVARTAYGFPMIAKWHDNTNRIGFEGSYGIVAEFIQSMPEDAMYIDIGANQGFTCVMASRVLTRGQVIGYEPSAKSYALLNKNIALNSCSNVSLYNRAISQTVQNICLDESNKTNTGAAHISSTGTKIASGPISLVELPDLARFSGIFIKIDTEGYELEVLKGMAELLSTGAVKKCVVEINEKHLGRYGSTVDQVYKCLERFGLRPQCGVRAGHYDEIFSI